MPSARIKPIVSPEEAAGKIKDGDSIAVGGFVALGSAETVLKAVEKRFFDTKHPRDLTLFSAASPADPKTGGGVNHLLHPELVRRAIGSYQALTPSFARLALEERVESYLIPLGVASQLLRETAAGRPGLITKVGLNTFVDPRINGPAINELARKSNFKLVDVITIDDEEWLFYRRVPITVGIVRGTTADIHGNISMEREAGFWDNLTIAMAAKNCGGIVIAQVERIAKTGTINPKMVKIPGPFVDYLVIGKPEDSWQSLRFPYNPGYSGEVRLEEVATFKPPPFPDVRTLIARRAAMEVEPYMVVNIGVGMPEFVAQVLAEQNRLKDITLTVEAGPVGGIPAYGMGFGASLNPEAIIDMAYMFDFYDGGGLDLSFSGFGQIDGKGNVNVSKFGPVVAGIGGFMNIMQARKVVFLGTFTTKGLGVEIDPKNKKLTITNEGEIKKFVKDVEQITFNAREAERRGRNILYITERAVFKLENGIPCLIEIAPGVDVDRDIIGQMEFKPRVSKELKEMPHSMFEEEFRI
jgi:propionate CoA-transferase